MSAVVHARVAETLFRLRLRYVAERLDAVLSDAARAEPTSRPRRRITALAKAEADGQLADRLLFYTKPKLLLID